MVPAQPQLTKPKPRNGGAKPSQSDASEEPKGTPPYRYFVPGEKTRLDAAYFEFLIARQFRAHGESEDFEDIWPRAIQALAGFNVFRLSNLSGQEMSAAIESVGGSFSEHMEQHAEDIVIWAEAFWRIRQIYGSFRQYIRSFEIDGPSDLLKDMGQRLLGLPPEFLSEYLREAGDVISTPHRPSARPRQARSSRDSSRRRRQGEGSSSRTSPPSTPDNAQSADGNQAVKDSKQPKRNKRRFFRKRRNNKPTSETPKS